MVKMVYLVFDIVGRFFRLEGSVFFIKGSVRGICGLFWFDRVVVGGIFLLGEDIEVFVDEVCFLLMGLLLVRLLLVVVFSFVLWFFVLLIVDFLFEVLDSFWVVCLRRFEVFGFLLGLVGVIVIWICGVFLDGCRVFFEVVVIGFFMSIGGCGDFWLILFVGWVGKGGGVVSVDVGVIVMVCGSGGGFCGGRCGGWDIFLVVKYLEGLGMEKLIVEFCF